MGVGRRGWTLDTHGWSLALSPEKRLVMSVDSVLTALDRPLLAFLVYILL